MQTILHRAIMKKGRQGLAGLRLVAPAAAAAAAAAPRSYSHVTGLSPWQRLQTTTAAALGAFHNPERGDLVALLGEVTGAEALEELRSVLHSTPEGKEILAARPLINSSTIDMRALEALPDGTFGREYVRFMNKHGFHADERSPVKLIHDPELAYIMTRYRQTHDFIHTLAGLPPTVLGEVALKWLEMVQFRLPMNALSAFVGPLRLSLEDQWVLMTKLVPWACVTGRQCAPLITVMYEKYFEWPLDELRAELRLTAAPRL